MTSRFLENEFERLVENDLAVTSKDYFMMGASMAIMGVLTSPDNVSIVVKETKAYTAKLLEQKKQ